MLQQRLLGPQKTHGQQHQLGWTHLLAAWHFLRHISPAGVLLPTDLDGVNCLHLALIVTDEFFRRGKIAPRVIAKYGLGFFLTVIEQINLWPFGPRIVGSALQRRAREYLQLRQALAAMSHGSADTICTSIAAADHDHILSRRGNEVAVFLAIEQRFSVSLQKLHREMNALELAAFDGQVARFGGTGAKDGGVEFLQELLRGIIYSHFDIGHEGDAFLDHQINAPLHHHSFIQLHIGNAVGE